jgi:hypothetical protein
LQKQYLHSISSVLGTVTPKKAADIHSTDICRYVQTRERGTVGIVAGGVDSIARAIDLGREGHLAQIVSVYQLQINT